MAYKLTVLNSSEYNRLADHYPKKVRERIRKSQGFTDKKNSVSYVRRQKDIRQTAGVAMHEILEMAARISPDEVDGLRFKGEKPQPSSVTYVQPPPPTPVQTPEDKQFFEQYWQPVGIPYAAEQFQAYKDLSVALLLYKYILAFFHELRLR